MKDTELVDDGEGRGQARWRRRDVLFAATALAGASVAMRYPGIPSLASRGHEPIAAQNALLKQVLQALGQGIDSNAADAAMSASVDSQPSVDSQLSRILRAPAAALASQAPASVGDLKQLIRDNIEADYRAGEICVVNGWWLSATEASCLELIGSVRAG